MAGNSPARETLVVQVHCLGNYPLVVPYVEEAVVDGEALAAGFTSEALPFSLRLYLNLALITFADSQNLQAGAFNLSPRRGCEAPHPV